MFSELHVLTRYFFKGTKKKYFFYRYKDRHKITFLRSFIVILGLKCVILSIIKPLFTFFKRFALIIKLFFVSLTPQTNGITIKL